MDPACPHCDGRSFALEHPLVTTENFRVVCDGNPLTEGHILIIPKWHISCMGALPPELFDEFANLYKDVTEFLVAQYGSVNSFEHGVIGQTVFHAHMHLLPLRTDIRRIVPEMQHLREISSIGDLSAEYDKENKYLFCSVGTASYLVDTSIGTTRFFRDRFAKALSHPERGDWKAMRENDAIMDDVRRDIRRLKDKWRLAHV